MSNTELAQLTHVKGYFNPNPYRVNVSISELNISFPLEPQQFVKVRGTGQKVNDPIFDRFVGAKMLSPEIADKPVPVVRIPVITPPPAVHPGYVVGQGHRDSTGKWVPPVSASGPALAPIPATTATGRPIVSASSPSIKGMSMEQARKLGYIGKQRLLDENYGAAETDGAPTTGDKIPPIRYSMEAVAPRARNSGSELPQELLEDVRPDVAPVVQQMHRAAKSNPDATPDLSRKAAEKATREQMGEKGVKMLRNTINQVKAVAKAAVARPAPVSAPVPAPMPAPAAKAKVARVAVPPAPVEELVETSEALSPLMGGADTDLPAPNLEPAAKPVVSEEEQAAKPTTEDRRDGKKYVCGACGKEYPYKSYYVRHLKRTHPDRLQELTPH